MGGAVEARVGTDGQSYYLTDLFHRFAWWQCKGDALRIADNVQRIQIRKVERHMLEMEELSGGVAEEEDGSGEVGVIVVVLAAVVLVAAKEEAEGREAGVRAHRQ
jgi:hypothetical protein